MALKFIENFTIFVSKISSKLTKNRKVFSFHILYQYGKGCLIYFIFLVMNYKSILFLILLFESLYRTL